LLQRESPLERCKGIYWLISVSTSSKPYMEEALRKLTNSPMEVLIRGMLLFNPNDDHSQNLVMTMRR